MFKIPYILCSSLLLISVNAFALIAFSQNVTNHSNNIISSVFPISKINDSAITVINAVGDLECSKNYMINLKPII